MPVPIIMPKFGFTLESCQIIAWMAQVGDTVREGDPIAEVETDKVNMEVEATADGTIAALLYNEGDDVPVTEVIAYLALPDEDVSPDWQPPESSRTKPKPAAEAPQEEKAPPTSVASADSKDAVPATPVAKRIAAEHNIDLSGVTGSGGGGKITKQDVEALVSTSTNGAHRELATGKVAATPAARRIAAELKVDLSTVPGTGPNGRIQGGDVRAAAEAPKEAQPAPVERTAAAPVDGATEPKVVPLRGLRKRIATRLQQSYQDAPHIYFEAAIDMRGILSLREQLKAAAKKVSVTTILVKACAQVLTSHPYMNTTFDGENISLWPDANIGVAVALDNGLIVPVVHAANRQSLRDIDESVALLAEKARAGQITPDELQGGTFTISNLGMYGVDRFTAIINPPQVSILAVGRTVEQFVPDADGNPVLRPLMNITVSADHRVVDGAQVALFLNDLRAVLEEPALMLW